MDNFTNIAGQEIAKKLLNSAIDNKKIAHGYLFVGPSGLGKLKTALEFAKYIQCKNIVFKDENEKEERCRKIENGIDPDVLVIDPLKADKISEEEGTNVITVGEIRDLEHHLSLYPLYSEYKIAIINGVNKLTEEAANAFLKTLEEPKGNTVIILIAETKNFLPQTLISRTQIIRFCPIARKAIEDRLIARGASPEKAEKISLIAGGKIEAALEFYRDEEKFSAFLEEAADFDKFLENPAYQNFLYIENLVKNEEKIKPVLARWLIYSRELLLSKYAGNAGFSGAAAGENHQKKEISSARLVKFINNLNSLLNLINTSNVNKKLALENLALEI